jgi:hypothetical protein
LHEYLIKIGAIEIQGLGRTGLIANATAKSSGNPAGLHRMDRPAHHGGPVLEAILQAPGRVICKRFSANIPPSQCVSNQEAGRRDIYGRYAPCAECEHGKKIAKDNPGLQAKSHNNSQTWPERRINMANGETPAVKREKKEEAAKVAEVKAHLIQAQLEAEEKENIKPARPGFYSSHKPSPQAKTVMCKKHPDRPGHKGQARCLECMRETLTKNSEEKINIRSAHEWTRQAKSLKKAYDAGDLIHVSQVLDRIFMSDPDLLAHIREEAEKELRTPENQIVYLLRKVVVRGE